MNRITISLPDYLANRLKNEVPNRQVSQFVSEALEQKLVENQLKKHAQKVSEKSPIYRFLATSENYPQLTTKKIHDAIQKGRR